MLKNEHVGGCLPKLASKNILVRTRKSCTPNIIIFGILVVVGAMRATCPAYLSLACLQKVSTAVTKTLLFHVFAETKLSFAASAVDSYNKSTYDALSFQVFPHTVCKQLYCMPSSFLICFTFQFHVSHP